MADATQLERIYLLKTAGLKDVLNDINAITTAFKESSEAKAQLAGGGAMYDAGQLTQVNKQLEQMLGIQEEMLSAMKGLNTEVSKSAPAFTGASRASSSAADTFEDLSNATKSLGNNLSGVTPQLLRIQTTLNAGNVDDYDTAINKLVGDLAILQQRLAANKTQYDVQFGSNDILSKFTKDAEAKGFNVSDNKVYAGKAEIPELTAEYQRLQAAVVGVDLTYDEFLKRQMEVKAQIGQTVAALQLLNKTYNPAINDAGVAGAVIAGKGETKANQQLDRTRIEQVKNESIAVNEEATAYQRLVAELNIAKAQLKAMYGTAQQGTAIYDAQLAKVQQLDAEYKKFNKTMGNNQVEVGNYGLVLAGVGNVTTMFIKQLARGIGSLIIWGLLFDAITKASDALKEAIPGTEEYTKKQEELAKANETLIASFKELSDTLLKLREDQNILFEGMDEGLEAAKRNAAIIQALGTVEGRQGLADIAQAKAKKDILVEEYAALKRKYVILSHISETLSAGQRTAEEYVGKPEVQSFLAPGKGPESNKNIQFELFSQLKYFIQQANLPLEQHKKIMLDLNKGYESGANLIEIYNKSVRDNAVELKKNTEAMQTNTSAQADVDRALLSKNNALVYTKTIELEQQLNQAREGFRQLREKEDVESVDRIVADTTAKYRLMYISIQKAEEDYIKQYSGDKNDPKYLKTLAMYGALLGGNVNSRNQDIANQSYELTAKQHQAYVSERLAQITGQSGISSFNANYGQANYGSMAKALDEETKAKKAAIQTQFEAEVLKIEDFGQVIEAQKQRDEKLIQVDKEMYVKRLGLGAQYTERLIQNMRDASEIIITQISTDTLKRINKVLEGKGSQAGKDKKIDKFERRGIINTSNEQIIEAQSELDKPGGLRDAAANAKQALDNAREAHDIDKITLATEAEAKAKQKVVDAEKAIEEARRRKNEAKKPTDDKDYWDAAIQLAEQMADAWMQLQQKQDAYRQEMSRRNMEWAKTEQQAVTQSKQQQLATDKAYILAQQAQDKEKMRNENKRAKQQLAISYVIALAKAMEHESIIEGVAATLAFAFAESQLAKAPAYGFGTGNATHPGGLAWVGDRNESEVIISPNKPTLMNLPAGSQVIPMSQIPGDMGASLQAPRFVSTSTSGGGNGSGGSEVHENAIQELYNIVGTMGKHLSNMQVGLDTRKLGKTMHNNYFKQVKH